MVLMQSTKDEDNRPGTRISGFIRIIGASRLLAGLALVLFAANLVHFLTRGIEDSYYPVSYSTIYFPTDRPVVSGWQVVDEGLEAIIKWDAEVTGWRVLKDGELISENTGKAIFFPTRRDQSDNQTYMVVAQPEGLYPPFEMKVRFLSEEFHSARGLPSPDYSIVVTDEPMANFKQFPVSEWVDTYDYMSEEDLTLADSIIHEKMGILDEDPVLVKLEKLMVHFRDELGQACRGAPPPDFRWKSPLQIYQQMRDGTGQGYCTQHGQIFVFFANRAGLSTRLVVGARRQRNNFVFTGHTWVETWIPEQARWAWVEPSYAVIWAKDKNGRFLNSVEIANLRQHAAWEGVTARIYKDWGWPDIEGQSGTLVDAPFDAVNGVVERQFITSSVYKWRRPPNVEDLRLDYGIIFKDSTFFWGNLVRYYFKPPLAYANYPSEGTRTYWIRHLLLWSFLTCALGSLAFRFLFKSR